MTPNLIHPRKINLKGLNIMIIDNKYPLAFRSMFREYDIRGKVCPEELSNENVYKIVSAYAKYLKRRNITRAVVGYDSRSCSPAFGKAATEALLDNGVDVFFTGLSLSPVTYFAQYHLKCEGAVMITASHNPDGWSGFKFANGYSKTLEPDDIKEVYSLLDLPNEGARGRYEEVDPYAHNGSVNILHCDGHASSMLIPVTASPYDAKYLNRTNAEGSMWHRSK